MDFYDLQDEMELEQLWAAMNLIKESESWT